MSKYQVFISYSRMDSDWAREFAKALKQRGVDVWFDQFSVGAGEPLREAIEQGLRESNAVVALINPESLNRPALFFELGAALAMGKKLIAIVPKDFDESQLPYAVRLRRYLIKQSPDETANELMSDLSLAGAET